MAKPIRVVLPVIILALGVLLTVLIVKSRPRAPRVPAEPVPLLVRVQAVELREIPLTVRSQGTVQPSTAATLVAEVAGKVTWVAPSFAAGGFFRKGQSLVRLDDRDYELAVTRAKAQQSQANVRLKQVLAEADIARREWQELGTGRGEPSPLLLREPQVEEARAALSAARAALQEAELALSRTVIRAPYEGRVRAKQADIGQFLAPGQPVGSVYAVDFAEVRLPVPDEELAFLDLSLAGPGTAGGGNAGPPVTLSADFAGSRQTWSGQIVRTEGEIDPRSRMVQLVARVERPYAASRKAAAGESQGAGDGESSSRVPLAVGMFVDGEIHGPRRGDLVSLPRTALREGPEGEDAVLVLDDESRLRFRAVDVLRRGGTEILIADGLEDAEQVCVSPLETPVDGMKVRTVVEPEGASGSLPARAAS